VGQSKRSQRVHVSRTVGRQFVTTKLKACSCVTKLPAVDRKTYLPYRTYYVLVLCGRTLVLRRCRAFYYRQFVSDPLDRTLQPAALPWSAIQCTVSIITRCCWLTKATHSLTDQTLTRTDVSLADRTITVASGVFRGARCDAPPLVRPWKFFTGDFIWKGAFFAIFQQELQNSTMFDGLLHFQISEKWANLRFPLNTQKQKVFQLQKGFARWPPDQGLCPWTPLGAPPQTPVIGSRSARSPCPPLPNPKYATDGGAFGTRLCLSSVCSLFFYNACIMANGTSWRKTVWTAALWYKVGPPPVTSHSTK